MKYLLALALIMIAGTASAQRIRDMSLSPEESMQQPDISHSQGTLPPGNWSNQFDRTYEGEGHAQNLQYSGNGYEPARQRYFMESFCSPQNKPLVRSARLANMTVCIEEMKVKACDAFRSLPAEAQGSVDGTTECIYSMEDTPYTETKACAQFERQQLALVKKYWASPETAYAILFIPDMVSNPMMFCSRR